MKPYPRLPAHGDPSHPALTQSSAADDPRRGAAPPWVKRSASAARRARQHAEEGLRQRLELVVSGANAGLWDWDVRSGKSEYSPSWLRLLGYAAHEIGDQVHDWLLLVHPEDCDRLARYMSAYLLDSSVPYEIEFRARHRDGTYRWFLSRASAVRNRHGRLERVFGVHFDISDRKRAQEESAALFAIATDVNRTLDLKELLESVQRRAAELLPCDRVVTYRWDAGQTVQRAIAWHGIPADLVADTAAGEFHRGERVVDSLLAGETVRINDVAHQDWVPAEMLAHFRLTALLLVPLVVRGHRIGALAALHAESGRRFSDDQVVLLHQVAQQVGIAMEMHEIHQAQQDEASVSRALARVGHALIASLSTQAMLDRLCEITTDILGCDYSHTWIWQPKEQVFTAVAGHGDAPQDWEVIRLVKLDRAMLAPQLQRLEREGLINASFSERRGSKATDGARAYGATVGLMVPLRRGNELLGFHTAGYRGRGDVFDARQERIAHGIGHLASIAFENARLMEALQQANRLKSDFVSMMSHELRTPLNVILGYTDLMLDGTFDAMTPEQVDTLQKVHRSARELLDLVNTTLDLSRLESARVPLDVTEVRVADLIAEVDGETRWLQERSALSFLWAVAPELRVSTDPTKLKLALKNLLGNAIKFTKQGTVTLEAAAARDGGVEIAVTDTGVGIAPEVLSFIFEPFRQGDSSTTREHGGVGLGLYVVRRLLELLGGTISVESMVGRGSTFRVWLPAAAAGTR